MSADKFCVFGLPIYYIVRTDSQKGWGSNACGKMRLEDLQHMQQDAGTSAQDRLRILPDLEVPLTSGNSGPMIRENRVLTSRDEYIEQGYQGASRVLRVITKPSPEINKRKENFS